MLKQLDDQSNDVQGLAVKCLGILFKKVQEAQVRFSPRAVLRPPRAIIRFLHVHSHLINVRCRLKH